MSSSAALVMAIALTLLQGVLGQGDDCSLRAVGLRSSGGAVLNVPKGCRNGTVDWHYPRGDLTLNFSGLTNGQWVCLQPAFLQGTAIATVADRTFALSFTNIGSLTACVPSTTTEMSVKFNAPSLIYYLNPIDYAIFN